MIKYSYCLIALLLISCINTAREEHVIHVSVLRGPSAIAFAQWIENPPTLQNKRIQVKVIDSPDLMQALLIKRETDIAVVPMINAANLYNKGIHYLLAGCPVWGTLYMVEKRALRKENAPLYLFGAGTTPEILTRYYLNKHALTYPLNYSFATAREIVQGLYMDKIERAVLSEPFLSIALQKDSTLHIVANLNNLEEDVAGYAQSAILINPDLADYKSDIDSLIAQSCRFAGEEPEKAIRILEKNEIFPAHTLTKESIERSEIRYLTSYEAKESITHFLRLIYDYEPKAIGGKLPDEHFINGTYE